MLLAIRRYPLWPRKQTAMRLVVLPPEVWSSIFGFLLPKYLVTLSRIVQVCRIFRIEGERLLWRSVNLQTPTEIVKRCGVLVQSKHLALHVYDLSIYNSTHTPVIAPLLRLVRSTLLTLDRLRTLQLVLEPGVHAKASWVLPIDTRFRLSELRANVEWDRHFEAFIARQSRLEILTLYLSSVPTPIPPLLAPKLLSIGGTSQVIIAFLSRRRIKKLNIFNSVTQSWRDVISPLAPNISFVECIRFFATDLTWDHIQELSHLASLRELAILTDEASLVYLCAASSKYGTDTPWSP